MFDATHEILNDGRVHKYTVTQNGQPIPYSEVLNLWQYESNFRSFFISLLSKSPFSAYRWETPSITKDTSKRQFEFVLLNSPGLARNPDKRTFSDYFRTDNLNNGIVVFENLGKDAILVAPSPRDSEPSWGGTAFSAYSHLAAFIRGAPDGQKQALWRIVGQTVQQKISDHPLWVSTAGGGVAWLHVRLDSRPKYYGYKMYSLSDRV
ncbi:MULTISPECIES: DUF6940 family protein [Okeania]|uniref:Uncharacterized protein n=1 Tax=Okeania hirsuta TaxID=1458930 RepID=A0A3N6Q1I1_9CYAN|nr:MULTISPECIES: hypothetical protein [Okeania]NET15248.1 hypothetical protein [Okeania sp. SIO1H6]NES74296.1 hypothetical protein [Okeania sp. SIO1H4]NES88165.1 hypothetical protein [Okeania sp. SIO2B9]NET18315.1 hypothetical protein [Okeania sp. SIO1H5]NET75926.1 hypothetical protein [Okeania sp. SIO1F9]